MVHDGVHGLDPEAEREGQGRAFCLVRWRGTRRPDSGPAGGKGPERRRPAASDPVGRCSIRRSSSVMELLLPGEAAALKLE